jgi:hypothetical protein
MAKKKPPAAKHKAARIADDVGHAASGAEILLCVMF